MTAIDYDALAKARRIADDLSMALHTRAYGAPTSTHAARLGMASAAAERAKDAIAGLLIALSCYLDDEQAKAALDSHFQTDEAAAT
jgi:cysteine sulfinate desulfinase/cysteine desulfurase-like protein